MTAPVWIRGILQDHYCVPVDGVAYFTGGEGAPGRSEKIKRDLPSNMKVKSIGYTQTLAQMLHQQPLVCRSASLAAVGPAAARASGGGHVGCHQRLGFDSLQARISQNPSSWRFPGKVRLFSAYFAFSFFVGLFQLWRVCGGQLAARCGRAQLTRPVLADAALALLGMAMAMVSCVSPMSENR